MTKKSAQEEEVPTGIKIYLSHPWNLIQTGYMLLTWIAMSIHIEIIGPTMSTVATNVQVAYSGMGFVLGFRGVGYLVSTILAAILPNIVKKHSEGLLACAYFLPAIAVFTTPFVRSLVALCILFFIQGFSHGLAVLCGNHVMLTMWGNNVAAPLNLAQLGYGVGAVIGNLLVRPFLPKTVASINTTLASTIATETKANIFIPYTITAIYCALIALGHVFFYIRTLKIRRKEKLEVQQVDYSAVSTNADDENLAKQKEDSSPYSPRTCGRGYFRYGLVLSSLFISSIFFIFGNDQTFAKFFFTFMKFDQFNISTRTASWGIILYWLSYSIGRLIAGIVSVFVPVYICLSIVWFGAFCLAVVWLLFVWMIGLSATSLFVFGAITGLVFAPIIPLTMTFFNQRLNVVPFLLALVLGGAALGIMIFPQLGGNFNFDTCYQLILGFFCAIHQGLIMDRDPNHFPTLLFVCISMSILFFVISNVIYFFHQRKNTKKARTKAKLTLEGVNEEKQEMTTYLKAQEEEA